MRRRRAPKRQRMWLAILAVVALVGAGVIAAFAMKNQAAYFHTPADLVDTRPAPDKVIRLGGLVKPGSLTDSADGLTHHFIVTDTVAETAVSYRGLVPDLFREGQGMIATGRFGADGVFIADELLARHDENYIPPEVAKALEKMPGHAPQQDS